MRTMRSTLVVAFTMCFAHTGPAWAANAAYQGFFSAVCAGAPTGPLAVRCGETTGGAGDLSGDSETSLNMNQPLNNNDTALARARSKIREVHNHLDEHGEDAARPQPEGKRFSLLINGRGSSFDRDRADTDAERGLDGSGRGIEIGFDYLVSTQVTAGALLAYDDETSKFDSTDPGVNFAPPGNSGRIDAEFVTIAAFASVAPTPSSYLVGALGVGLSSYDIERKAVFQESNRQVPQTDLRAKGDPDGNEIWASVGSGYDFDAGAWSLGPYLRVSYADSEVDAHTETDGSGSGLAMRVARSDRTSLTSDLGLRASYTTSVSWGVLVPQLSVEYEHEFDQDAAVSRSSFVLDDLGNEFRTVGDDPDRNYFNVSLGLVGVLARGVMGFIEYREIFGYEDLDRRAVTFGTRIEW